MPGEWTLTEFLRSAPIEVPAFVSAPERQALPSGVAALEPRFDAYTATGRGVKPEEVIGLLCEPGVQVVEGRGFHQFAKRWSVRDACGEIGAVQTGGVHGDLVMVEVKGERTPAVVEGLRAKVPEHRCTRVDSCIDFEEPGAFERLLEPVLEVKAEHRLYGEPRGDWKDFPELGRTQYLGAKSSVAQARLYEKGKQPEYVHLQRFDWCRLEVQVRPQKDARERFSRLTACEVWGAGRWTRDLAERVFSAEVMRQPAGTVWRSSTRDAAIRWMVRQYATHLVSLASDLGGFDVMGLTLGEMIEEEGRRRGKS